MIDLRYNVTLFAAAQYVVWVGGEITGRSWAEQNNNNTRSTVLIESRC